MTTKTVVVIGSAIPSARTTPDLFCPYVLCRVFVVAFFPSPLPLSCLSLSSRVEGLTPNLAL